MDLSVVVPTLNGRDRLAASLDSLAAHAPEAEVIVVNGPSADGTTGMVRDRDDVDVLVEISARCINVARNAGIRRASGDAIALLGFDLRVGEDWFDAVVDGLAADHVVTGPVTHARDGDGPPVAPEQRTIAGRRVTYFDGTNVAFRATTLRDDLDGFDEYLETGGARDAAHRLAGMDRSVGWRPEMAARDEFQTDGGGSAAGRVDDAAPTAEGATTGDDGTATDGTETGGSTPDSAVAREDADAEALPSGPEPVPKGPDDHTLGWKYRALCYRLTKNYGPRPTVARRVVSHATVDAATAASAVLTRDGTPSGWFASGREVVTGIARGCPDGLVARAKDRTPARNPNGLSTRSDRAVAVYDRR